ncbi:hypothetical protein PPACK8108_LOCUS7479 [Phakopsora pachyrhizi]|uniref:Uncharacterized protein n=1 Tax=Phakopsora pachyrhizi TaxID=170000 RepID=A0AAV0AVR8_PHAPC|nr:hypothetical protein PPACK8108_LOCUS7479 [Phakopsora pachyrhizi]
MCTFGSKKLKFFRSDAGQGVETSVIYNLDASLINSTMIEFSMFEEKIHGSSKIKKNFTMLDVKGFGFERGLGGLTFDMKIWDHLKQEFETQTKLDVSGSYRVPMIQATVKSLVGYKVVVSVNADEAAAMGLALYRARISQQYKTKDIRIKKISSHSISAAYKVTRSRAAPDHGKTQAQEINTVHMMLFDTRFMLVVKNQSG